METEKNEKKGAVQRMIINIINMIIIYQINFLN